MHSLGLRHAVPAALVAVAIAGAGLSAGGAASASPDRDPVPRIVRGMTLEEKVGQLFVASANGVTADTDDPTAVAANRALFGADNAAQLIEEYHVGALIYFGGNLVDTTQVAQFSNDLQTAATTSGAEVPLLLSTDEEGGYVTRMPAPFATSPGNMALGAGFEPEQARTTAHVIGEQLRAVGITVDDAPVVDVNTNPANQADGDRAFGDDTEQVGRFGAEAVRGFADGGVASVLKHFPGLGSAANNTDDAPAESDQTKAEFFERDIPAFDAAIEAGADSVMVGHLIARSLDESGAPASLSPRITTGILRKKLGFDGVVITDALNAGALEAYTDAELAVGAIKAGADQLLMPRYLPDAFDAVVEAVQSREISRKRLNASVTRILEMKRDLGLFRDHQVDVDAAPSLVGTAEQAQLMAAAARRGITLYRNDGSLPYAEAAVPRIAVIGWGIATTTNLTAMLTERGHETTRVWTDDDPDEATIAAAVEQAKQHDLAIVTSRGPWTTPAQGELITRVHDAGVPTVVLSVGAPYELGALPGDIPFIGSFGYQPPSLAAAVDVIFGEQPLGRSPITIRNAAGDTVAAYGDGLTYPDASPVE